MRFMRMCLTEVMEAAARRNMAVLVKHNMYDGFKGGIEIPESIEIAREIERFGVNGIVLSGASSRRRRWPSCAASSRSIR